MIVEKEVLDVWEKMLEYGDVQRIAEESGIDKQTISSAKNNGECTEKTFLAINEFVAAKKARIEESAKKITE